MFLPLLDYILDCRRYKRVTNNSDKCLLRNSNSKSFDINGDRACWSFRILLRLPRSVKPRAFYFLVPKLGAEVWSEAWERIRRLERRPGRIICCVTVRRHICGIICIITWFFKCCWNSMFTNVTKKMKIEETVGESIVEQSGR